MIRIHYQDESALNLSSLHVMLNDSDATSFFTVGDSEAIVVWPSGLVLPEGLNKLTAKIQDLGRKGTVDDVLGHAYVCRQQVGVDGSLLTGRAGAHA